MVLLIAVRGEHVHVRPLQGHLGRSDVIQGYRIVGYEFSNGRYQDTIVLVDGIKTSIRDLITSMPRNMRVEVVPFPVYDRCCNLHEEDR